MTCKGKQVSCKWEGVHGNLLGWQCCVSLLTAGKWVFTVYDNMPLFYNHKS